MASIILLHLGPEDNVNLLPYLKSIVRGRASVKITNENFKSAFELVAKARNSGVTKACTSSERVLQSLLGQEGEKLPSLDNYAGSIFERFGIEILILPPLDYIVKRSYGKFVYERFLSKFIHPKTFINLPKFEWEVFNPAHEDEMFKRISEATFMACDIETTPEDKEITCFGFCTVNLNKVTKEVSAYSYVIPFNDIYNVAIARRVAASSTPKAFQNGKYDNAYLIRYNIPITNYCLDTINLFHCWLSELPKDLGFITSFMLRNWIYWKDESKTSDLLEYYQYNAKDNFGTAMDIIALLLELPEYAWKNYSLEFPTVFPCILAETTGLRVDTPAMQELSKKLLKLSNERLRKLRVMVNNPNYNPRSPQQTVKLFDMLGSGDIKSSGKIQVDKVSSRHPLNKRILSDISKYREEMKMESTYVQESKIWHDRIYYALNPHATDTGRLASKESQFSCKKKEDKVGLQIHNIPRDKKDVSFKSIFVADAGFYFGEADCEQNETRGTGYLSGDLGLIRAVEDKSKDYHGSNASKFFGIPYASIICSTLDEAEIWQHKTIDKSLRDLSKRTNHGANYNMGAAVMLDTMGIENVIRARQLLKLPAAWSLLQVTAYLLKCFAETYPTVKGAWYEKCTNDVENTGYLVGPTGWTRRCFGHPRKNKLDLNSYVAHPPQSLAAMVLNQAWVKVFNEIWVPNSGDFKLHAQIHDSIFFSYRIGRLDLALKVKKLMEIPTEVTDTFGIKRTLIVPVALKAESTKWNELKDIAA